MTFRAKAVAAGFAEIKPTREMPDETPIGLVAKIGAKAIEDSGIPFSEIDGLITSGIPGAMLAPSLMVEVMGLRVNFAEQVEIGGATSAGMIWRAAAAIANGMCTTCLCTCGSVPFVSPQPAVDGQKREKRSVASSMGFTAGPHREFDTPFGALGVNYGYALIAQRYMHEYGVTSEQFARVAVDERANACANPDAFFYNKPITIDDVLASPMIVDPLHMLDMVMMMGGAAAVVMTSAANVKDLRHRPVYLLGAGEHCTHWSITSAPSLTESAIRPAADRAFDMAGVGREKVGLASVYDCYTHVVLLTLEDAGFCTKGAGGRFVDEHDLRWNGDFPVNTHGGQLSFGQAGIAGGMSHVTEAIRQLQGRAEGRQVKDLEFAFVNGNGGTMSEQVSLVFGLEP
jgi:acetyl-CoA C-acetyltransferase